MTRARDLSNFIGSGSFSSTTFTATAGQTVFTIAHTQGFVQVFMNGLLLDLTVDYTSNGSAITLTSAAVAGDEIEVVKYDAFSVGDAVPASGGTFTGNVNIPGHVVQVVNNSLSGMVTVGTAGSLTYGDVHTATITPKFNTSKILLLSNYGYGDTSASGAGGVARYLRNGTVIADFNVQWASTSSVAGFYSTASHCHLDSPATTSQITYKLQATTQNSTDTFYYNPTFTGHTSQVASLTLMEIAQ